MQVKGAVVLVTGATGGIGRALCHQLDAGGAQLILNGRDAVTLQALADELSPRHLSVAADIGTPLGRDAIVRVCEHHRVDGVVNLAGILDFALFSEQDPRRVQQVLEVNVVGTLLLVHALLPSLLLRPRARLLNVGSIFGSIGYPGFAVYCASKAALQRFSEALSRELADTGVSVAYIAPRATATALNDARVTGLNQALGNQTDSPQRVAAAIRTLFENDRSAHYMGWPQRCFVKLNALLPTMVRRALVKQLPLIKHHARQPGRFTGGSH